MPSEEHTTEAADLIWNHWQAGTRLPELPPVCRPGNRAEGYAIQARLEGRGAPGLFGWKIAATSQAGQRHINVSGPLAGRILPERAHADGAELPFGGNAMAVAEPEFAFKLGRDVAPRTAPYSVAEALEAVASLHPAIEVPDSRFADFTLVGDAQLLADNACAHEFVLGAATTADWRGMDLVAHQASITATGGTGGVSGGEPRRHEGVGANVLGDPRVALAWLLNEVTGLGITLAAGQVITTGTCAVPIPIGPGDAVLADFGVLGSVSVRFQ